MGGILIVALRVSPTFISPAISLPGELNMYRNKYDAGTLKSSPFQGRGDTG